MGGPDVLSRRRRWCWTERTTFATLWVVAIFAGLGLAWWRRAVFVAVSAVGVAADVNRHRRR